MAANDTQSKYAHTVNTRTIFGVLFASYASTVLIASSLQFSFDASDDIAVFDSKLWNDDHGRNNRMMWNASECKVRRICKNGWPCTNVTIRSVSMSVVNWTHKWKTTAGRLIIFILSHSCFPCREEVLRIFRNECGGFRSNDRWPILLFFFFLRDSICCDHRLSSTRRRIKVASAERKQMRL